MSLRFREPPVYKFVNVMWLSVFTLVITYGNRSMTSRRKTQV